MRFEKGWGLVSIGQGKRFLRFLAYFFAPGEVVIDGILESKAERLDGLSLEENNVSDVAHMTEEEFSIFVISEVSNVAFVFHSVLKTP